MTLERQERVLKLREKQVAHGHLMTELQNCGPDERREIIGQILGEICEREQGQGRPLLSALAVSKVKGMPNPGFWELSAIPRGLADKQRPIFWAKEALKVIDYWQSHPVS